MTAATWHGMGEEDTTEAVVQPRSGESHTLDLLDPNDTLDVLTPMRVRTPSIPRPSRPKTLAPWGLDPEPEPEPSHETLALPLDDRPPETHRRRAATP